jgi:predicted dehydrogenase
MVKFGLIGCGNIGPRHAEQMSRVGKLQAVCDIKFEKAQILADKYNCEAYSSIKEMLAGEKNRLDVMSVCTPNGLHALHTVKALKAGLHVLCEKPMAISVEDGLSMIAAADETGKKLFVVKSTRYNPAVISLKKALENNALGKICSFQLNCFWNRPPAYYENSWKGSADLDGGTLFTQFSHYLDVLYWLLGDCKNATGLRKNLTHGDSIAFEDTGTVVLEMKNGSIGGINWSVNTYKKNMEVSLTLIGEKGIVKLGGEYMNVIEYQSIENYALEVSGEDNPPNDYGFYRGSMSNHDKVYDNLILALNNPEHPFVNGNDGLKTIELIRMIYQNAPLT